MSDELVPLNDDWIFTSDEDPNAGPIQLGDPNLTLDPSPQDGGSQGDTSIAPGATSDPFATTADVNTGWVGEQEGYGTSRDPFYAYSSRSSAPGAVDGGFIQNMIKSWDNSSDTTKTSLMTIGAGFLKDAFGAKGKQQLAKNDKKRADAAMLAAQTNADALRLKTEQLAKSQYKSAGLNPSGLIYQPAAFIERQNRAKGVA